MKKKLKLKLENSLFIFLILLLIPVAFLFVGCNKPLVNHEARISEDEVITTETEANNIFVVLKIDNGQHEKEISYAAQSRETAFDLMKELKDKEEIDFTYQESNVGVFINSINNIENDVKNSTYWMFYVNDELASVGVGGYVLLDGDILELKYINTSEIDF
ncbi:DUF4430 domain-containing protein [Candidatus Parcubacteria bacterium]|nr:DUF4430 domain-containing protein [Candidatus Parcubacteria bacterium]